MEVSDKKKRILWILATVVLGAVGSGLWDLAVKPLLVHSVEFFVDVVLGAFKGIQDTIYRDIASLRREITGRIMLSFLMGGIAGTALIFVRRVFLENKRGRRDDSPSRFTVALFAIFICVFSVSTTGLTGYIVHKQDVYLQLKRIASPYLSENERLETDSQFALVASLKDYDDVLRELRDTAGENGVTLPEGFE